MNKTIVFFLLLAFLITDSSVVHAQFKQEIDPSRTLLPTDLKVYPLPGGDVTTVKKDSLRELILPTVNKWLLDPGCYLTCVTKDETQGVYPMGNGTYVAGQMRVPGHYDKDGMCKTNLKKDEDLSTSRRFKYMCNVSFKETCKKESCWAEAKTGHLFDGH